MNLRLNCPECKEKIEYRDINIDKAIAKCRKCENIFEFEKVLASAVVPKAAVRLPEAMEAYYMLTGFDIEINWRKSSANFKFFLFFAIFWNGVVSIFVVIALASGNYDFLWPMSFHIIIGLGLLYYIFAILFNKTYILFTTLGFFKKLPS